MLVGKTDGTSRTVTTEGKCTCALRRSRAAFSLLEV